MANRKEYKMSKIEKLKKILEYPQDFDPVRSLENLANILLNEVQIKKGQNIYRIICAELYIYNENHPDPAVYERNCPAGMWYFHSSGVDISFKSFYELDNKKIIKNSTFGGILVRGIELLNGVSNSNKNTTNAPLNVCDELFDKFNAFDTSLDNFPQIIENTAPSSYKINFEKRVNITAGKLEKRKEKFESFGNCEDFSSRKYKFFI